MRQALHATQAALALALASIASIGLAQQPSDRPSISRLYGAALDGRAEKIQDYLRQGDKVNEQIKDGYTPLHVAALQGGLRAVEVLLAAGADPNIAKDDGETPLHCAVSGDGDLKRVKALVKAGARLDLADNEGITPVRQAAIRGGKEIYEWLLAESGGKEPEPRGEPSTEYGAKTTRELVAMLAAERRPDRIVVHRDLVIRGNEVPPEIRRCIESGVPIDHFYELLVALGDRAGSFLPLIIEQLEKPEQVFGAGVTIERLKPGALAELPAATRRKAAEALYVGISDPQADVMAGFYGMLLLRMGEPAIPTLLRLIRHDMPKVRRIAASLLADAPFKSEELQVELLKLLRNGDIHTRTAAARALGKFGEPTAEVRASLTALLKDPPQVNPLDSNDPAWQKYGDWKTLAEHAARSLGRFGPAIIDDLLPLLTPINKSERMPAIDALASLGPAGVPRLVGLLSNKDKAVAISASSALSRMGPAATLALAEAIRSGDEQVVENAASALTGSGAGQAALPALFEVAGDAERSDLNRTLAAWAALKVDSGSSRTSEAIRSTITALIRVLETGEFKHRGIAAEALRWIGPPAKEALPALSMQLELPGPEVDTNGLDRAYVQREAQKAIEWIQRTDQ